MADIFKKALNLRHIVLAGIRFLASACNILKNQFWICRLLTICKKSHDFRGGEMSPLNTLRVQKEISNLLNDFNHHSKLLSGQFGVDPPKPKFGGKEFNGLNFQLVEYTGVSP